MIYQLVNKNKEIKNFVDANYSIKIKEADTSSFETMLCFYSHYQNYNSSVLLEGSFVDDSVKNNDSYNLLIEYLRQNKSFLYFILNKSDLTEELENFLNKNKLKYYIFDKEDINCKFYQLFKRYKK